jgi:hypothetical protein
VPDGHSPCLFFRNCLKKRCFLRSFPAAPSGSAGKSKAAILGGPLGGTNVHRTFVEYLRLTLTRLTAARDVFEAASA